MRNMLYASVALAALAIPGAAFAQSTGSMDFENDSSDIVVTGQQQQDVGGVEIPETPKAKVKLDAELLQRQRPGQTINDVINLVPGVSFQNNDAYGASGGGFRIRGFDSSRISQTLDGIPLNDSGNYAIYTNQQVDIEVLSSVTVDPGSTDVDSPTASAVGGTVNLTTREPSDKLGAYAAASYGEYDYARAFVMIDTGDITGIGTKAFASASSVSYNSPFNNYGKIKKQQFNASIYQDIGSKGDFVQLSGHYNQNRNNFYGSLPLRLDRDGTLGFPETFGEAKYTINYPCNTAEARPGVADTPNGCGTEFDRRFNPSNTGNIRARSRFTLADGLIFTLDPSYQYVKANGGGTVTGYEAPNTRTLNGAPLYGYVGNRYAFGTDLNGDGDLLDQVTLLAPSQTVTNRVIVISNLIYDFSDTQRIRLAYTFDRAQHRQTGELGFLRPDGSPFDVFPINDPIEAANGYTVEKRDRKSYATLHQISAEYRGKFLEDRLVTNIGFRLPFFSRELDQRCFTTTAGGFVDCVGTSDIAAYAAANPTYAVPQKRDYNYNKFLPTVGFTYNFTSKASIFGNWTKGLSAPNTDQLYSAIYYPKGTDGANPKPEQTNSFDLGVRYNSSIVQAQVSGFYIDFTNKIATAFDPQLGESVSRNIGKVKRWGVDASISVKPIEQIEAYFFGSYLNSEIQDDLQSGADTFLPTGGKQESGISNWMFGTRLEGTLGPVVIGGEAKYTGPRYINDVNLPLQQTVAGNVVDVFPAKADGYTLVNLDASVDLSQVGLTGTRLQFNVTNLFNKFYVGYIGGSSNNTSVPFVQVGAPRAVSGSLIFKF